jgi:transcriptional regulator with XRE-family HTH domain
LAKEKSKTQNISENLGVSQSTLSQIMHNFTENQEKCWPEARIVLQK